MERICGEDMKVENEALGGWEGVFVCPGVPYVRSMRLERKRDGQGGDEQHSCVRGKQA